MKFLNLIIFAVLFSFLFTGCEIIVVSAVDGLLNFEVGNVDFIFDIENWTVTIYNYNSSTVTVKVEIIDYPNNFTVCETTVSGNSRKTKQCRVRSGDTIKIIVLLKDEEYTEIFKIY